MWGNFNLRRLPHRLEPQQSTPNEPFENLSEWGFTSPESTFSAIGTNRYQRSSTLIPSNANANFGVSESSSSSSPSSQWHTVHGPSFQSVTPIRQDYRNYFPSNSLNSSSSTKSKVQEWLRDSLQRSAPPTNFNHDNLAPRRQRRDGNGRVILESGPAPVENLFDTFDNNPSYKGVIEGNLFIQKHYCKNYGRPQCKHSRESRAQIRDDFFGEGGIKDNKELLVLDPFSRADLTPTRAWSPSHSTSPSASSNSSDGRHSWF